MKKKIFCAIIIILVISIIVIIGKHNKVIYKQEDRIENIKKFSGIDKEKAISWIKVQGTNIDLPVLYYYNTDDVSDPTYDIAWSYTKDKTLPSKTTIFSHNVLNVSRKPLIGNKDHRRFEQLMAYIYYDFVKDNKYIQYTINNKNYSFKIYGVSFEETDDIDYNNSNLSKKEIKNYIKKVKKNSYFEFDTDVNETDKLITLVTCTRFFGSDDGYSFVVNARLLKNGEKAKNYGVVEKNNYTKIKNIMKGAEE